MKSYVTPGRPWNLVALLVTPLLALTLAQTAFAGPGEADGSAAPSAHATADGNSLTQLRAVVGQVVLSEDACGTTGPACTVDIVKPSAAATVRQADLFCATVAPFAYTPEDDDVTLNGVPVAWAQVVSYTWAGGAVGHNTQADVTAIVKPVGDAAPPGVVIFTITEDPTSQYDGCALKVIWDDPTTGTNSIFIFWGHQQTTGDTFVINFAPLIPEAFATPMEFSLGISFSFQPSTFTQVDVNSMRLTTSAGGQDDGEPAVGGIITLGGTGDTAANPDPFAPAITPSLPDDELYDLRPFVMPGDTSVTIFTLNPSNDDNVFLANLFLRNVEAVTPCPPADDADDDGLNNNNEKLLLTLLDNSDSDDDGIKDGNDDENGNGEDDEDEDDDDECPDEDEDNDGVEEEDEDD
jgi:hypothetical protein